MLKYRKSNDFLLKRKNLCKLLLKYCFFKIKKHWKNNWNVMLYRYMFKLQEIYKIRAESLSEYKQFVITTLVSILVWAESHLKLVFFSG